MLLSLRTSRLRVARPCASGLRALRLSAILAGALVAIGAASSPVAAQDGEKPKFEDPFPAMPKGFSGLFTLRDSRALDMMQYMHCMNTTIASAQQGMLGSIPENALVVCIKQKNEWRGVFGTLDADRITFAVLGQVAIRGVAIKTTEALDTAASAAVARAMMRGAVSPTRGSSTISFTMVPLRLETFLEVWFMPVQNSATRMYVGGDSVIQMTPDGRREQGHTTKAPAVREVPMAGGNVFVLESTEEEVPLISELMAARLSLLRVPEVRVRTKKYESVLSNATRKWVHTPRAR